MIFVDLYGIESDKIDLRFRKKQRPHQLVLPLFTFSFFGWESWIPAMLQI